MTSQGELTSPPTISLLGSGFRIQALKTLQHSKVAIQGETPPPSQWKTLHWCDALCFLADLCSYAHIWSRTVSSVQNIKIVHEWNRKCCDFFTSRGAIWDGVGFWWGWPLDASLVMCFGHVQLEGSPEADPGPTLDTISLNWSANAIGSPRRTEEREVWTSLLRLVPLQPKFGWAVNEWMDGCRNSTTLMKFSHSTNCANVCIMCF